MVNNITVENIKKGIGRHVGKRVIIKANKGRKKNCYSKRHD